MCGVLPSVEMAAASNDVADVLPIFVVSVNLALPRVSTSRPKFVRGGRGGGGSGAAAPLPTPEAEADAPLPMPAAEEDAPVPTPSAEEDAPLPTPAAEEDVAPPMRRVLNWPRRF